MGNRWRFGAVSIACALAALLSGACTRIEPSFVSSNGVGVYLEGHKNFVDRGQADAMEDYLLESVDQLGYPGGRARDCLRNADVTVVGTDYVCWGGIKCGGEQRDRLLYVVDTGCPSTSAYVHELAHWLQECVYRRYDPQHQEQGLWDKVNAQPDLCPQPLAAAEPAAAGAAASGRAALTGPTCGSDR